MYHFKNKPADNVCEHLEPVKRVMGLLSSLVFASPLQMLIQDHENNVLISASGLIFAINSSRVPLCRTRANDEVSVLSSGLKRYVYNLKFSVSNEDKSSVFLDVLRFTKEFQDGFKHELRPFNTKALLQHVTGAYVSFLASRHASVSS